MQSHLLAEQPIVSSQSTALTIFLVALLTLYAVSRLVYPRYWKRFQMAMIYPQEVNHLFDERNSNLVQVSLFLNLLAILSISSFLYLAFGPVYEISFFWILEILGALTLLKYYSTKLLGYVLNEKDFALRFNHLWLMHLKFFGFSVLITTILYHLVPDILRNVAWLLTWIVLLSMHIMSHIRGFFLLRSYKVSLLYGILYLCTLEILPILMIIRLING